LSEKVEAALKTVLLIDAVNWSDAYAPDHPLRNVGQWFKRHFTDVSDIDVQVARPDDGPLHFNPENFDGLILSGSPRDAWDRQDPVNDQLIEVAALCRDKNLPFLGVCYGHQILARALGGVVERHPDGLELGTVAVRLTDAGRKCPVFDELPSSFDVMEGHVDYVTGLPDGCHHLISGDHTPMQGIGYNGFMFGVQFHPEMNPEILRYLWTARLETWRERVTFDLDERLKSFRPADSSAKVLLNFLKFVSSF
jgi:GMP synthase (glutamine-hydrolysing)